jgi:hypothetical protein
MAFRIYMTKRADEDMQHLAGESSMAKHLKAVKKALAYMGINTRHPSLHTHKYSALKGLNGAEVFEAYAQNNTASAYRIFWQYGLEKQALTILGIVAHP